MSCNNTPRISEHNSVETTEDNACGVTAVTSSRVCKRNREARFDDSIVLPSSYFCVFCNEVVERGLQLSCRDRCHVRCLEFEIQSADAAVCRTCSFEIDFDEIHPDVFIENEFGVQIVYCLNKQSGCVWKGEPNDVLQHAKTCDYATPVGSSHSGQRTIQHEREKVVAAADQHSPTRVTSVKRDSLVEQEIRTETVDIQETTSHSEIVKKNLNEKRGTRLQELLHHISSRNEEIADTKKTLRDAWTSLDEKMVLLSRHVQAAQSTVTEVESRLTYVRDQQEQLTAHQTTMKDKIVKACDQSVENIRRNMADRLSDVNQFVRLVGEKMNKLEDIATKNEQRLNTLPNSDTKQEQDSNHGERQLLAAQDRVLALHDFKLSEHTMRLDLLTCKNTSGVLLWKITEIGRRRRDAATGKTPSIYSQPFYSSPCGYKMCARLFLNGDGVGKGSHLSLFFVIMRGEHDALLPWPFAQRVTLVLVDQDGRRNLSETFKPDESSSSFQRPRGEVNVASGCPLFASLVSLDNGGYIREDTIYIKIIVDKTGLVGPDAR